MVRPTFSIVLGSLAYSGVCGFALLKGGRAERLVGAAMLLELLIMIPVADIHRTEAPRYVSLVLDILVLGALLYAAFSTERRWVLLASAFQSLSVLTHLSRIIDPSMHSWAYITVDIVWGYGLMLTLLAGTLLHLKSQSDIRSAATK